MAGATWTCQALRGFWHGATLVDVGETLDVDETTAGELLMYGLVDPNNSSETAPAATPDPVWASAIFGFYDGDLVEPEDVIEVTVEQFQDLLSAGLIEAEPAEEPT